MIMKSHHHIDLGKSGFTLIELMVVLTLIAILTAVMIPEMRGTYEDALLKSVSRELVSACNVANGRAIAGNQRCRIRIDRAHGRYVLEKPVKNQRGGDLYAPIPGIPGSEGKIDPRISIAFRKTGVDPSSASDPEDLSARGDDVMLPVRDEAITFYPDGTADGLDIKLEDRQGFRLALRINPVTARIRIIEPEKE